MRRQTTHNHNTTQTTPRPLRPLWTICYEPSAIRKTNPIHPVPPTCYLLSAPRHQKNKPNKEERTRSVPPAINPGFSRGDPRDQAARHDPMHPAQNKPNYPSPAPPPEIRGNSCPFVAQKTSGRMQNKANLNNIFTNSHKPDPAPQNKPNFPSTEDYLLWTTCYPQNKANSHRSPLRFLDEPPPSRYHRRLNLQLIMET